MAGFARSIMIPLYVVDTGYLLELYRVDGCFDEQASDIVNTKFVEANERNGRFYVPVPVLFELANHIADVKNPQHRRTLSERLNKTISSCLVDGNPWILLHPESKDTIKDLTEALHECAHRFASGLSQQRLGLTDTVVIMEAERLKGRYKDTSLKKHLIHIWTRHSELKAYEPDKEPDPFV